MVFPHTAMMQQYDNFFQTVESYFISSTTAERTLFLAVILQALLDATQKDSNDLEICKYKREAILWFTTKHGKKKDDFEYICELADIESNYMRTTFIRSHINAILTHRDSYDRIKLKKRKGK